MTLATLLRTAARLAVALLVGGALAAEDWPEWRGRGREGVWRRVRLPPNLDPAHVKRVWQRPIGGGYSGIAVTGGKVLTMDRPPEKGNAPGVPRTERVLALDARDGGLLWAHEYPADYGDMDHPNGPRSTPAAFQGRVFAVGAAGRVSCLDLDSGAEVWAVEAERVLGAQRPTWGHAASPLVDGDLVIVQLGARPGGTIVALDRQNGRERWRALADRTGYASPQIVEVHGKRQILVWTADALWGLAPEDGAVLWRAEFRTSNYDVAILSPLVRGDVVFASGFWDGARAFRIGKESETRLVWKDERVPSCVMATPLSKDRWLYAVDRNQGLVCVEWETGKLLWADENRLTPKERNPHASMVWAGEDRAVSLNALGELVLTRLRPEGFEDQGRVSIIGKTWAHPAFSGQEVYARSDTEIVCVRVSDGS